ncbi:MAG TPA: hypothetical protein VGN79_14295 [Devosia sp.]|jgi:hypothetical protein|nr:hypothetical protein [Devosia sp.]
MLKEERLLGVAALLASMRDGGDMKAAHEGYVQQQRDMAKAKGLTFAEFHREDALATAKMIAERHGSPRGEAYLLSLIFKAPGSELLSDQTLLDIAAEALEVHHDRRAQIATEGTASD